MVDIRKTIPNELDGDSKYAIRIRSINTFGIPSDWSEALVVDTTATGLVNARRLVINEDGMVAYDSNGQLVFGYFGSTGNRTNYVKNPSFEINTSGWTNIPNSVVSYDDSTYFYGQPGYLASLKVTATATISNVGTVQAIGDRFTVATGELLTVSAFIKTFQNAKFRIGLRFYDGGGNQLSETMSPSDFSLVQSELWNRISAVAISAPNSVATAAVVIKVVDTFNLGSSFNVDGVLAEKTGILREYFDGSTSLTNSSWRNTPHSSFSDFLVEKSFNANDPAITDGVIKTSPNPHFTGGIRIDNLGLTAWNNVGVQKLYISALTGSITAEDGVFTGGTFQTSLNVGTGSPNAIGGVVFNDQGIRGYSGTGTTPSFIVDATTGAMTAISGLIGGWNINSSSLSNTNVILSSAGEISVGTNNDIAKLSSTDAEYRLWIGSSDSANAGFRVTKEGVLTATGANITGTITAVIGSIGGWTIGSTTLTGGNTQLNSAGEITVGTIDNIARLSSLDPVYRIWVGHATSDDAPFKVSQTGAMVASAGTIGGINIGGSELSVGSGSFKAGMRAANFEGDIVFYAGSETPGAAQFRVTNTGQLTANSASITGTITATNGVIGGFTIGASTLTAGSTSTTVGISTGATTSGIAFWTGDATPTLAPFRVDNAGELTATNATITGNITATTGYIGTPADGWVIDSNKIRSQGSTFAQIGLESKNPTNNPKIYIVNTPAVPGFGNSDTPFYADSLGQFSLADKLLFDPGNIETGGLGILTVVGRVRGALENYEVISLDKGIKNPTHVQVNNGIATLYFAVPHGFMAGDTIVNENFEVPFTELIGAYRLISTPSNSTLTFATERADATHQSLSGTPTTKVREMTLGLHPQITSPDGGIVSPAGLGVRLDEYNYWFLNNQFRVGTGNTYIRWNGGTFTVKGHLIADSGNFAGNVAVNGGTMKIGTDAGGTNNHGIYIAANDYWYDDGRFRIGGANGISYSGSGSVNVGTGVTIEGNISGGTIDIGGFDNTSFHVDVAGNMWLGAGTFANSPFKVSSTGNLTVGGENSTSLRINNVGQLWVGAIAYSDAPFRVNNDGDLLAGFATFTQNAVFQNNIQLNNTGNIFANGTTAKFGNDVSGTSDGLILNANNYWFTDGTLRIGGLNGITSNGGILYLGSNVDITNAVGGGGGGGNADYATEAGKLQTARQISLAGGATGSTTFDGSTNVSITATITNDSHTHDTRYYTQTQSDDRYVNVTGDTMTGDLTVGGNLTVNGSTVTVNTSTLTVADPLITLGGSVPPSSDDSKDRGIEFRWHTGTLARLGFFGFDRSTQKFTFISNGTNTAEVFSGDIGEIDANLAWARILSKPSPQVTVTLTGAVTGSGAVTLTELANGTANVSTSIAADAVTLGAHTTGNYIATITGTANQVTVTGSGTETAAVVLSLPQNIHTAATPTFSRLVLSQTTGTAPMTVTSQTRVDNLNVQLLDGNASTFYRDATNMNAGTLPSGRLTGSYTGITQVGTLNGLTVNDIRNTVISSNIENYGYIANAYTSFANFPSQYMHHDMFRFGRNDPIFEKFIDGAWTTVTTPMALFDGKGSTSTTLVNGTTETACRFTWTGIQFSYIRWIMISFGYTAPTNARDILIETSTDGTTWTTRCFKEDDVGHVTPGYYYIGSGGDGSNIIRLTLTWKANAIIPVTNIMALSPRWGAQGVGPELDYPYTWDSNKSIILQTANSTAASTLIVRQSTGQSGSLQQWQNSGNTTLSSVNTAGSFFAPSFNGDLLANNGTAGTPSIRFTSDTNTGIYRIDEDTLGFATNGVNKFTIDPNGTARFAIMPTLDTSGEIRITRHDGVGRDHIITAFNSGTSANNYLRFAIHNGSVSNTSNVLTLRGDQSAEFDGDVTVGGAFTTDILHITIPPNSPQWGADTSPFYVDSTGALSVGSKLLFDPGSTETGGLGTLTVVGKIRGAIENYEVQGLDKGRAILESVNIVISDPSTAQFTTKTIHEFAEGDTVIIENLPVDIQDFNGALRVIGVPNNTSFTVARKNYTGLPGIFYLNEDLTIEEAILWIDASDEEIELAGIASARVREMTIGLHPEITSPDDSVISPAGLGIRLDEYNYWFLNNVFRVGNSQTYVNWNGNTFTVKGRLVADSGDFVGNMTVNNGTMKIGANVNGVNHGIFIDANNNWYDNGTFMVGGEEGILFDGTDLYIGNDANITGTITATNGVIGGFTIGASTLTAGSTSTTVGISTGATTSGIAFWTGDATPTLAPFRVENDGDIFASRGSIGGFTLTSDTLYAGSTSTRVGISTGTGNEGWAFWSGSETIASAQFRVTTGGELWATNAFITGEINATSGTFNNTITVGTHANKISIVGAATAVGTKIYSGVGTWWNSNTGFYFDASGQFSLGNKLVWNGTSLAIEGEVVATSGSFTGTINANAGTFTSLVTVGSNADDANRIKIAGTSLNTTTAIYTGTGTHNNSNTPFRIDASGRFSLGQKLVWSGSALTVEGAITATSGTFTGTVNANAGNFSDTVTIGQHASKISIVGHSTAAGTKIFAGGGNYSNEDTGFYMDASGRFSVSNKLFFNGSSLTVEGAITATSGTFTGTVNANAGNFSGTVTVGQDTNKISIIGTGSQATTKIHSGVGNYSNEDTGFYMDASGRFSLRNRLIWDGNDLSVFGNIGATGGNIGGWAINSTTIYRDYADGPDRYTGMIGLDGNTTRAFYAGATAIDGTGAPFYVQNDGLLTASNATVSGNITATDLTVNGNITATIANIVGGYLNIGGTAGMRFGLGVSGPNNGLFIDANNYWYNTGNLRVGDSSRFMMWDGSELKVTGEITADSGTIGGFTIGASTLTAGSTSTTVGISTGATTSGIAFWTGDATPTLAPFRVTNAGALTATNANITGTITATSGSFTGTITANSGTVGGFTIGASTLTAGSGATTVGISTGATTSGIAFYAGNATATSAPFKITSGGNLTIGGEVATSLRINNVGQLWVGAIAYSDAPFRVNNNGDVRIGGGSTNILLESFTGAISRMVFNGDASGGGILGNNGLVVTATGQLDLSGSTGTQLSGGGSYITLSNAGGVSIYSYSTSILRSNSPFEIFNTTNNDVIRLRQNSTTHRPFIAIEGGSNVPATRAMFIGNANTSNNDVFVTADKGELLLGATTAGKNVRATSPFGVPNGTTSMPGLYFASDTGANTGWLRPAEDQIEMVIGGFRGYLMASTGFFVPLVDSQTTGNAANLNVGGAGGKIAKSTSSIRYKRNVEDLENQYADKILEMRPVWYQSKCPDDNQEHGFFGLIAEEVAEIEPRLIHWTDDGIPDGVQYDRFVPGLISIIKRLEARVRELES